MIANPYRGEVELVIDGQLQVLRLTLGALASLEGELGAVSFSDLVSRFEQGIFSSEDVIAILRAGLFGAKGECANIENAVVEGGARAAVLAAMRLLKLGIEGYVPQD